VPLRPKDTLPFLFKTTINHDVININDRLVTEFLPKHGAKALAVLLVYAKHMNAQRRAWPSAKTVQEVVGIGQDARNDIMSILVKEGYLKLHRVKVDGKVQFSHVEYEVVTDLVNWVYVHNGKNYPSENDTMVEITQVKPTVVETTTIEVLATEEVLTQVEQKPSTHTREEQDPTIQLYEVLKTMFFDADGSRSQTLQMYISGAKWRGDDEALNVLLFRFSAWLYGAENFIALNAISGNTSKACSKFAYWLTDPRSKQPVENESKLNHQARPLQTSPNGGTPQSLLERARSQETHWFGLR